MAAACETTTSTGVTSNLYNVKVLPRNPKSEPLSWNHREILNTIISQRSVTVIMGESPVSTQRVPDLFKGAAWMSNDFDDSLSEELFIGE